MLTNKGISQVVIELILVAVVILIVVLFLVVGKVPKSYGDIHEYGNATLNLWNKVTDAEGKKARAEQEKLFLESFNTLASTYTSCLKSQDSNCWCHFPKKVYFDDAYFLTFQQVDATHIALLPQTKNEEGYAYLLANPAELPGELCLLRGSPFIVDYLQELTLPSPDTAQRFFDELGLPKREGDDSAHVPFLARGLYKFTPPSSLSKKPDVVCLAEAYAEVFTGDRICR